jgi:hypothetical protein
MPELSGSANAQILVYRFGPGANFEGRLVGALERIETGGALRILDALFIRRDADSGELDVASVRGSGAGGLAAPLTGFRLDAAERRRVSRRALEGHGSRLPADVLKELGSTLEPGDAVAAVLVDHRWLAAMRDAVARSGGTSLKCEFVDASSLAELAEELVSLSLPG